MRMKRKKGTRKIEKLFLHIPPIIKAKGGRAGRRYRDALTLKRVRRIKKTINQMRKKDSLRCQSPLFRLHRDIKSKGRSTDQGANSLQILRK
jgi:hypothetical protein